MRDQCFIPLHHLFDRLVDRQCGGIKQLCIRCGPEWRGCALTVTLVALTQIPEQVIYISRKAFWDQLLIPPGGTGLDAGREKHLERCIGENNGAHVAAVGNQPRRLAECALARNQRRPNLAVDGNR